MKTSKYGDHLSMPNAYWIDLSIGIEEWGMMATGAACNRELQPGHGRAVLEFKSLAQAKDVLSQFAHLVEQAEQWERRMNEECARPLADRSHA